MVEMNQVAAEEVCRKKDHPVSFFRQQEVHLMACDFFSAGKGEIVFFDQVHAVEGAMASEVKITAAAGVQVFAVVLKQGVVPDQARIRVLADEAQPQSIGLSSFIYRVKFKIFILKSGTLSYYYLIIKA